MEKDRIEKIRSLYGLILALFSVVVGLLFIVQTWRIYTSTPESPYTPERIQETFRQIALPVWLWVALVVGGGVFAVVYPEGKSRPKAYVEVKAALSRTKKRLPRGEYNAQIAEVENREENFRGWVFAGTAVVCATLVFIGIAIVYGLFYAEWIGRAFFTKDGGRVDRLFQCGVFALLALTAATVGGCFIERSRRREQTAYLVILAQAKKGEAPQAVEKRSKKHFAWTAKCKAYLEKNNPWAKLSAENKQKTLLGVRIGVGVLGVVFVVWGIFNGGMADVLLKAIAICTQCIGLG